MEGVMTLLETLASLNRKERFYLVGWALGNPTFRLSDEFRQQLGDQLGVVAPEHAFAAMDYHLDWLYAALAVAAHATDSGPYQNDGGVTGTQEDVDLLVAFEDHGLT